MQYQRTPTEATLSHEWLSISETTAPNDHRSHSLETKTPALKRIGPNSATKTDSAKVQLSAKPEAAIKTRDSFATDSGNGPPGMTCNSWVSMRINLDANPRFPLKCTGLAQHPKDSFDSPDQFTRQLATSPEFPTCSICSCENLHLQRVHRQFSPL